MFCPVQDGQRHTAVRAPAAKPGRTSLQVVAFRENRDRPYRQDYRDQTSIGTDLKRGAKQAQVGGTNGSGSHRCFRKCVVPQATCPVPGQSCWSNRALCCNKTNQE